MVGATLATSGVRRPTRKGCPNRAVEFKRGLAAAACEPGISVAKLALEHGVNTNLLFKWRREYRAGKFGAPDPADLVPPAQRTVPVAASRPTRGDLIAGLRADGRGRCGGGGAVHRGGVRQCHGADLWRARAGATADGA